nr:hypothetical protein [Tanacetum cinerariifolium]
KSQSFRKGGTNDVQDEDVRTSPELIVPGVISLRAGPELLCSEAIVVSASKSTCMVSTIRLKLIRSLAMSKAYNGSICVKHAVAIASAHRNNEA